MSGSHLLSLEEALERILDGVLPLRAESLPLSEALGRVMSEDVTALLTLPPWDNSAMDGYAVRAEDVAEASLAAPVTLRVIGEVAAGHEPAVRVETAGAVRVLTGAMIPPGADAVVKVEDTDAAAGPAALPASVGIRAPASVGQHIRRAGSDMRQGDALLSAGKRIGPAGIALLAAAGHARVDVHRRPRVAIVATGDELTPIGEPLGPASIPDSNSESIAAQVTAAGAEPLRLGIAGDDPEAVRERLLEGILAADVLIVTGGVSVGAHDVVKQVFADIGSLDLWRVAIQPGKPLAYGSALRPDGGHCLLFGLPGNPVSSFVTFELFVRPALRRLRGETADLGRLVVQATLGEAVTKSAARRAFVRVRLEPDPAAVGRYLAHLAGGQGSYVLTALAAADGLAIIPEGAADAPTGTHVEVIRLDAEIS
jgi:molybdenum cofactor synthesis domain-containing protein